MSYFPVRERSLHIQSTTKIGRGKPHLDQRREDTGEANASAG